MRTLLLIICGWFVQVAGAQEYTLPVIPATGANVAAFVPSGYDTLAVEKGDLNKDGRDDYAIVLKPLLEDKEIDSLEEGTIIPDRILLIVFDNGGGYIKKAVSHHSILCKECGGIFGEPFEGIMIEKGVLIISHYGGSAWRWSYTHKFRYQQNGFYLIGETRISYWNIQQCDKLKEFAGTEYYDVNYLTGSYEKKKVSAEGCRLLLNKKGKQAVKPLLKLDKFNIEN